MAEELHFGRAALRMHVTQQSVSEQIRRLERELGAPLFARTSRRVALTGVGETFLPHARRTLAAAHHALDVGRSAAQGVTGEVRVGYADDLGSRLFLLVGPELARRSPSIKLTPQPMTTPDQIAALTERRLDLALGWTPALVPGLDALLVAREPLVIGLRADDPLAAEPAVDPAALSGRPLTVVPRAVNPLLHDRIVGQLIARGADVAIHQEIPSLDRMLPLVVAGSAIALTSPRIAVERPFAGVVYRALTDPAPEVDYSLVWRSDTTNAAVANLVAVVRELRDAGAFIPPALPR